MLLLAFSFLCCILQFYASYGDVIHSIHCLVSDSNCRAPCRLDPAHGTEVAAVFTAVMARSVGKGSARSRKGLVAAGAESYIHCQWPWPAGPQVLKEAMPPIFFWWSAIAR